VIMAFDLDLILREPWTSTARLLHALAHTPLDRTFEGFGDFEPDASDILPAGTVRFWGNFAAVSCVFQVDTGDPAEIETIRAAIARNKARPDYLAQETWAERKARIDAAEDMRRAQRQAEREAHARRVLGV